MAKKLILLPLDLYQGLLTSKDENKNIEEDLDEHAPLKYEKKLLKKIGKRKIKNQSEKNVLYNQQLRRYLKRRKEVKNRPIKVQLSDDSQNVKIIKADTELKEPVKVAVLDENEELQRVKIEEEKPSVRFASSNEEDLFNTADENTQKTRTGSSSTYTRISSAGEESSSKTEGSASNKSTPKHTPLGPKRRAARVASAAKKETNEIKSSQLLSIIKNNENKFGVKDGKILNPKTGKPVKGSDLKWAVNRLVTPSTINAPSPPGIKFLHNAIIADQKASEYLHDKYTQSGEGKKNKSGNTNLFRPAKWKK